MMKGRHGGVGIDKADSVSTKCCLGVLNESIPTRIHQMVSQQQKVGQMMLQVLG